MRSPTVRKTLPYVRQGPVPQFNRKTPVTKEEVLELTRQKQLLLDEKRHLVARIARAEDQNKHGGRPVSTNQQLYSQRNKELRALERVIAEQQRTIAELNLSDEATLCRELEEDAKIVFQEHLRLQDLQTELQRKLAECEKRLDDLVETEGPKVIPKQCEVIKELEEKLGRYKRANRKLKKKLEGQRPQQTPEDQISARIGELSQQIAVVEAAKNRNRERMEEARLKHSEAIEKLRGDSL
jgi:vacuolar-type H+-ATPase subunit I/STV1